MSRANGKPIPAAAYYRKSTHKQEDSIERQKEQVVSFAQAHGYRILEEYEDPGISGDEIEKQPGFQKMLKDAAAKKFEVSCAMIRTAFPGWTLSLLALWSSPYGTGA